LWLNFVYDSPKRIQKAGSESERNSRSLSGNSQIDGDVDADDDDDFREVLVPILVPTLVPILDEDKFEDEDDLA
jgi:hypothetical protein